jgi:hypothetical protein
MAMNALQGVVACLESGHGEITVDEPVRRQALGCIERMLDFVKRHPGSTATPPRGLVPGIGAAGAGARLRHARQDTPEQATVADRRGSSRRAARRRARLRPSLRRLR